jgi:hypothetical protein
MAHLGSFDHLSIDAPIVFVVERERERVTCGRGKRENVNGHSSTSVDMHEVIS